MITPCDAFRFAKHDFSKSLLVNECKALQIVKAYVEIPVTDLKMIDEGVSTYSFIKGKPIFRSHIMNLPEHQQLQMDEQLGTFLSQMHSIPMRTINENHITAFFGNGTRDSYLDLYSKVKPKLFPHMKSYTIECIENIFRPLLNRHDFLEYQPTFIHGDFASYHILDESNSIVGIIDFGVSGFGDPAHDVSVILDTLGEEFVKKISKYYKGIDAFIDR